MHQSPASALQPRDRFLAFAFAASDLLIEADADGIIRFATGAFRPRLGEEAARFIGRRVSSLLAAPDQPAFAMAMTGVALNGRITPIVVRLADAASTRVTLAALMMPGPPPRLCVTIGPVPTPPGPAPDVQSRAEDALHFVREAELALKAGGDRRMGLLEVENWGAVQSILQPADLAALRDGIGRVLANAGPGVVAGEIAAGRYGVLGGADLDVADVTERLRDVVESGPAAAHAKVSSTNVPLETDGLTQVQAARTLRYAVSRFAAGGQSAAAEDGLSAGLAGVIASSERSARAMRSAIAAHQFRLQYQPIVSLADRAIHHFEALLRPIEQPTHPSGSSQDFVLFAEMVGLAEELDAAVVEEALTALARAPEASIAVNVSGHTIQSPLFRANLLSLIANTEGLTPAPQGHHRLLVELTETAEIEDMQAAAAAIADLRGHGVLVCIDDFGAGGAAFRYLREFGVDYVKIDGLYVRAATRGVRERGFVASMVELAHTVGAEVVAEMIETEEQATLMRDLGVTYGQGWLFGRPGSLPGPRR